MTPIKIMSIDTGAGVVSYHPDGVEVAVVGGYIPMCEDSCFSAGDGVCDEPRMVSAKWLPHIPSFLLLLECI